MLWTVPFLLAAGSAHLITIPSASPSTDASPLLHVPTDIEAADDAILEKRFKTTIQLCKYYYTECKVFNKSGTKSDKETCLFMDKKCFPHWGQWHASEVQYSKTHKAPPPPRATTHFPAALTPNDAKAAGKGFNRLNMHQWVDPLTGQWSTTWWVFDDKNNIISGPVTHTTLPNTLGIPINGPGFDSLWANILNPSAVTNSQNPQIPPNNVWFNYQNDKMHVNKFGTSSKSMPGTDGSLHNKTPNACLQWTWYPGESLSSWYRNIDCYFHTKCGPTSCSGGA